MIPQPAEHEDNPNDELGMGYGIYTILKAITQQLAFSTGPSWSLYLINVETLIRDLRIKSSTVEIEKFDAAITICQTIIRSISAVCKPSPVKPIICFYCSKYENIDPTYLKKVLPKGTQERHAVRDQVIEMLNADNILLQPDNVNVVFAVNSCQDGQWPHKELLYDLDCKYPGLSFRVPLLVSHVPSDFHMYRSFNHFTILESYTGAFKHKRDLGVKVFGSNSIPFNKYTHLLLGDKWYLKQQVDDNTKKLIEQKASSENWNILPDKLILKSLLDAQLPISPSVFVEPEI